VATQPENPGNGSGPVRSDPGEPRGRPAAADRAGPAAADRPGPAAPGGPAAADRPAPTGPAASTGPAAAAAPAVPLAALPAAQAVSRAGHGRWRFGLTVAALALGLAGLAASAAGIAVQVLPRRFSAAEQQQIMAWQSARRWRASPAGRIFPPTVGYQLPSYALSGTGELPLIARRVGIAQQASCAAAADATAAAVLDQHGCAKMLRATYVDATGSLVVTVGVAVMRGTAAADASIRALLSPPGLRSGVRPLGFRDTLAGGFGAAQRQLSSAIDRGPYLVLSTAGYSDGRPRVALSSDAYEEDEMASLADGVANAIGAPLGALPPLPRCPGAPGC
jgi:hypothetical protein